MNRIWNSSYGDNSNIKRISNTVNFKIGQRVYGRIVKTLDVNQAIIKLLNGMELQADVGEELREFKEGILQFQVEGMKDDKLQLKLLERQNSNTSNFDSEIMKFIDTEGLSKDDNKLLQGMLKYDLNLSKDNIGKVKSLLEFNERIKTNAEEIDKFIEKFIGSKGSSVDTKSKQNISNQLKSFFNSFKSLTADDILLFLENNIEFNEENINSYQLLFKENKDINDILKSLDRDLNGVNTSLNTMLEDIQAKAIDNDNIEKSNINTNEYIKDKSGNEILEQNNKLSIDIKDIERNSDIVKNALNEISDILKENSIIKESKEIVKILDIIKDISIEELDIETLKDTLGSMTEKDVSDESFEKLFKAIKDINSKLDVKGSSFNEVKAAIDNKTEEAKQIIQKLLTSLSEEKDLSQIVNIMKNNINDIKMFNKFSNEYYYFNFPVNFREQEYPCKLIIKDNRKEGKQIDSKNIKLALNVKTKGFGEVDAFVKVVNKSMNIEISCKDKHMKIFEKTKEKLKNTLESVGFLVDIKISEKKYDLDLTTTREFFGENNVAGVDIKV